MPLPRRHRASRLRPLLLLLVVATAAPVAQAQKKELQINRTPPAFGLPKPKVVLNTGTYALVDGVSAYDADKDKMVEANCPSGLKVMSGGFSAASGRGEPPDLHILYSKAKDDGSGWKIYAMFDGSGNVDPKTGVFNVPAPFDWELRIRIVCAKV